MKPVKIYTTTYCPYCRMAKDFLHKKGVAYEEVDVTTDDSLREDLVTRTGQKTVPQIFIGDQSIGGYSDMVALEAGGKLQPLLG